MKIQVAHAVEVLDMWVDSFGGADKAFVAIRYKSGTSVNCICMRAKNHDQISSFSILTIPTAIIIMLLFVSLKQATGRVPRTLVFGLCI